MSNEWEVARASGRCAISGQEFAEGEAYYAVLSEGPSGLERRDYSVGSWTGPPEGSFCYWRARVPVREKKSSAVAIDQELLTQLFLRLEEDRSETGQQFRFVLALLLMRKKLLRFEGTNRTAEGEFWQLRLVGDGSLHQILNPQLSSEQVDRLGAQLTALLSGEVDALTIIETGTAPETAPAAEAPPPQADDAGGQSVPEVPN